MKAIIAEMHATDNVMTVPRNTHLIFLTPPGRESNGCGISLLENPRHVIALARGNRYVQMYGKRHAAFHAYPGTLVSEHILNVSDVASLPLSKSFMNRYVASHARTGAPQTFRTPSSRRAAFHGRTLRLSTIVARLGPGTYVLPGGRAKPHFQPSTPRARWMRAIAAVLELKRHGLTNSNASNTSIPALKVDENKKRASRVADLADLAENMNRMTLKRRTSRSTTHAPSPPKKTKS